MKSQSFCRTDAVSAGMTVGLVRGKQKGDKMVKTKYGLKKVIAVMCMTAMIFSFAACGITENGSSETAEPDIKSQETTRDTQDVDKEQLYSKYKEALENILNKKVLPDGDELITLDDSEIPDLSEDTFAICDVDGDGVEELLINHSNAPMVGMTFYMVQYDAEKDVMYTELKDYPGVTFYQNGYVTIQASHNQGKSGEFWPYAIYQYNAETDQYDFVKYIDAWDKEYFPKDVEGNAYQDDIDTSKTGIVYYLYSDLTKETTPVDVKEYDKLVNDTYGKSSKVKIPYQSITAENVAAIDGAAQE